MKTYTAMKATRSAALAVIVVSSIACGGGGKGGSSTAGGGGIDGGGSARSSITATFHVDVASGAVTVTPNRNTSSRAIFSGSAVTFNSSLLLDQPGNVGVKTLGVSLTNNWSLPIGQMPNGDTGGLKVIFSNFNTVNAFTDLRPRTLVSTYCGSGSAAESNNVLLVAAMNGPAGIASAGNGVFYVADRVGNTIRKISGNNVSTLAGSTTSGNVNGQGAAARFSAPFGIALNPVDGSLFVTDLLNNSIRRVTPDGRVTKVFGTGTGSSSDGNGTSATTNGPTGIAIDTNGTIYIAEANGNRIRKAVMTGSDPALASSYTVSTVAGNGTAATTDGIGTGASLNAPGGLTVAPDGSVYVCEQNGNVIRRITPGGEVATIAGTGVASSVDGAGDIATFNAPRGIVWSRDALFVTDRLGNKVRQMTLVSGASPSLASSWRVASLAGTGGGGTVDGAGNVAQINQPQLIAADPSGNLYVSDITNRVRRVIAAQGAFPIGTPSGVPPTEQVQLSNPDGIVAQTENGANVPYVFYPSALDAGATSTLKNWWFAVPSGVNSFEFTVTVEAATGGLVPPSAATGAGSPDAIVRTLAGVTNVTAFSDGPGAQARMGLIKYSDVDDAGNLYFTDLSNNALRRITPAGVVTTIAGGVGNIASPADGSGVTAKISSINAVAVKKDGSAVFFGDGNQVRVATCPSYADSSNASSWTITTLSTVASAGVTNGALAMASFNTIEDMCLAPSGDLYLSEFFGNRIRKITYKGGSVTSASSWYVSTWAGDDSATNGASGTTDGTGSSARLFNPRGIDIDRAGNLYVADQSNFKIRKISPSQVVTTVAGTGVQGYVDGDALGAARFNLVYGVTVDSSGYVYFGDIGSLTIRRLSPGGVVSTVAGISGNSGGADGPGNVSTFVRPAGVSISPSGDLYVCDQSSIRLVQRLINVGTR